MVTIAITFTGAGKETGLEPWLIVIIILSVILVLVAIPLVILCIWMLCHRLRYGCSKGESDKDQLISSPKIITL